MLFDKAVSLWDNPADIKFFRGRYYNAGNCKMV